MNDWKKQVQNVVITVWLAELGVTLIHLVAKKLQDYHTKKKEELEADESGDFRDLGYEFAEMDD